MEGLFFDLQKDKRLERQIDILNFLRFNPNVTVKEIAKANGCSPNTVVNDIDELIKISPPEITIQQSNTGLYSLDHDPYFALDSLASLMAKQTFTYRIIDLLFTDEQPTLAQATVRFNISRSKYLNILNYMRHTLEKYRLDLKTSPLELRGKEVDKRAFFFDFFSSFSDFSFADEEGIHLPAQLAKVYMREMSEPLYFCFYRLTFWLSVSKMRWQKKKEVEIPEEMFLEAQKRDSFYTFQQMLLDFFRENNFLITLSYTEIVWAYFILLDCMVYSVKKPLGASTHNYIYHRKTDVHIIQAANMLIERALDGKPMPSEHKNKLIGFLINTRLLTKITPSHQLLDLSMKALIFKAHYQSCQFWIRLLADLPEDHPFAFEHYEDVAIGLTILHLSITSELSETKHKLNVLISFQGKAGFDDYLANAANQFLTKNIQPFYYLERPILDGIIQEKQPDLIVTNYDLTEGANPTNVPVLRLSNVPTLIDWGRMRDLVIKMQYETQEAISLQSIWEVSWKKE